MPKGEQEGEEMEGGTSVVALQADCARKPLAPTVLVKLKFYAARYETVSDE